MRTHTLGVTAGLLAFAALGCRARQASNPLASSPAPTTAVSAPSADKLVGRWLRSDADYTIEIAGVGADGKLGARYFNPNPIHLSRAETATQNGKRLIAVELRDEGYPGNFYTLVYDPGSDSLLGVYNHLGIQQQFEVAFSRISAKP
jgi:hypothetical protein